MHPRGIRRMADHAAPQLETPHPAEARAHTESDRGRQADTPSDIPAKGWKDILWRAAREFADDDLAAWARSIAFAGVLALFPGLAAFVAVYGLFADIETARAQFASLAGVIPAETAAFMGDQMVRIAQANDTGLGLTFAFGLALSLWSANTGMKALFKGLNIAYDEEEKRGFLALNLVTLAFTAAAIAFLLVAIGAVVALPVVVTALGLNGGAQMLTLLRWPALLALVMLGLSALYRYGPSRDKPQWRWVSWGGAVAAVLWLTGSALFSWYLERFADYDRTYGSLGAVFGFLMWLWLSALVVLLGAELNAEIEHQTARDTTEGHPQPMGARGAVVADHLGESSRGGLLPEPLRRLLHRRSPAG